MSHERIDLRSDTVTRPTAEMRQAMAAAHVGDDVIDVDPTVAELQEEIAGLLGKEQAVFMPSGSMTNQVGIRVHCKPGDEFLCDTNCHIFNYEQGAFAQLSGVVARTVDGGHGVVTLEQLQHMIRPENDHLTRTRLVCLENTHNRGGGKIQPQQEVTAICTWAHKNGLRTHLDGARLFNAAAATKISLADLCTDFDTVSVCFSKGLGAPVGSALVGSAEAMQEARRHRKLFGGGMRQSGIIAAGALFGLRNHFDRMVEDHANAQLLATAIQDTPGIRLAQDSVETNIVFFDVDSELGSAHEFAEDLACLNVHMLCESHKRVRALTHLDVTTEQIQRASEIIRQVSESRSAAAKR
ncbi:MAG: GntG family PLP-dependent aldolase [Pirellulaceae bacterium]|nr:GntG family PLP-dependent aldolase [Pirellulaceae bacterium]